MRLYVEYRDRGDIVLVWTEEDESQGHVFQTPQPGYHQAHVALPKEIALGDLATLPERFGVIQQNGYAVLVTK
jgi:hypothetical protein